MTHEFVSDDLRCDECGEQITLEQYRRKCSRCDTCEFESVVVRLRMQLKAWNGDAGARHGFA